MRINLKLFLKNHQFWIGMILLVFGGTYQVINAVWWGWWLRDLMPNILAPGAFWDGLTLDQIIARDIGFLAAPLFVITLVLSVVGVALLWTDTSM